MLLFYLHGFPDGYVVKRIQENSVASGGEKPKKVNTRQWCPRTEWYLRLVAQAKSRGFLVRDSVQDSSHVFTLLVVATVGVVRESTLTLLNEEGFWGFLWVSNRFFSLRIIEAFKFQVCGVRISERVNVKLHRCDDGHVEEVDLRESRRPDFVAPASRSEPYLPYVTHPSVLGDEIVLDRFGTPLTVSQVAQKLEIDFIQCLALPVVQPVLDLISHGLWKTIPCMGRWLPLLAQLPPQVQMQVGHFGSEPPRPEYGVLSPHQVREVATLIQEFAPEILRSARQRCDSAEAISVEARLHHSLTWLSNLHAAIPTGDIRRQLNKRRLYSSVLLVKCLLNTRLLPSYVPLKELFINAMEMLFSDVMKKVIEALLAAKHVLPSPSHMHRSRLYFDCALLLHGRQQDERFQFVRFGGADASPQGGKNWLLSSFWYCERSKLPDIFRAINRMILDCRSRLADVQLEFEQTEQSIADHFFVVSNFRLEHDIPAALGNRAESVSHKVSAMLHKWGMRAGDRLSLSRFRRTFFSFCTDLGTELGFGDFRTTGETQMAELLPAWCCPDSHVMEIDVSEEASARAGVVAASPSIVFESDISEAATRPQQLQGCCYFTEAASFVQWLISS